jgi:predicted DNA binding CopG/RHH family protein
MREPKLSELEIDEQGTRRIHRRMAGAKSVKITINIDAKNLEILRAKATRTGVPYQRLLNRLLSKGLHSDTEAESRLDRLEKEITRLKRKIVA